MDNNVDNVVFKKTTDNQKTINLKKQKAKLFLMEKYNVSSDEAEKIILTLESKQSQSSVNANNSNSETELQKSNNKSKQSDVKENKELISPKPKNEEGYNSNQKLKKISQKSEDYSKMQDVDEKIPKETQSSKSETDVDSIMSEIIPMYNQQLSIEVENVDLTFEVDNEKVDTLKESFINFAKRKKNNKIKIHALNNISFKIYKGEKIGIIGFNGAGKSTLLNVITGIYSPDSGFVKTYGNISPLLGLGAGFDYNYSGRKNIVLNGAVLGYEKEFLESKMDEIIEFSELGEFIDIPIKNYSSGMIAKLAFSIATAVEPDILIIDEILGVGDVNFKKKSGDKIRHLMDGGTTVLLVSHSIPQIRELCDKAIWIDHGKLKEMGEVNKVCDHYLKDAEKASNEQLANIQFR